jgi:hypothetical protein
MATISTTRFIRLSGQGSQHSPPAIERFFLWVGFWGAKAGIEPVSCGMRTGLRDAATPILGNGFMAAETKGDFEDRAPSKRLAETGLFRTHSSNLRKCRSYSVCIRK